MEDKFEYEIKELFEQLKSDESWEADEERRREYADGLLACILSCT